MNTPAGVPYIIRPREGERHRGRERGRVMEERDRGCEREGRRRDIEER